MTLTDVVSQLAALYPSASAVASYLVAHPTEAAAADLGVANLIDWFAGMALAALLGQFDSHRVPAFLRAALPTDIPAVYAAVGAACLAALVNQGDLVRAALLALAAAAAIYSVPTWADVAAKRTAIFLNLYQRLQARVAPKVA